ncbi:hypothetical protein Tco_0564591 [Tanacetum coccineum]
MYDALMPSIIQDEDDLDRVVLDLRKRDHEEDEDPSKTSKGDTPPKYSKTSKSASAEESVKEATHEVTMGEVEPVQENVNDADQPQDDEVVPKNNWFKQPPRPPTPDLEWNSCQVVDDQLNQHWFNNQLSAQKDPLTFEELMATPIDFSNFAKNRLWAIEDMIPKQWSVTKVGYEKDVAFGIKRSGPQALTILQSLTQQILKTYCLLCSEDSECVRRADRQMYMFKEGDFVNLHLNDIEDMLLLVVHHKLFNLDGEVIVDLAVVLRISQVP